MLFFLNSTTKLLSRHYFSTMLNFSILAYNFNDNVVHILGFHKVPHKDITQWQMEVK